MGLDVGYTHFRTLQLVTMVAQHVFCQHHTGGPELAAASRFEVLVKLDWFVEKAGEVKRRCSRGLVYGKGCKYFIKLGQRELWRK